jgi:hypothetical protein
MNGSMLMQLDCHSCDNNKQNQLLHEKNDGFFFCGLIWDARHSVCMQASGLLSLP